MALVSLDQNVDLIQPRIHTSLLGLPRANHIESVLRLGQQGAALRLHFMTPVQPLDALLRAKRDQYPDDDRPHFLGELGPAVPRLGFVDVHAVYFSVVKACPTPGVMIRASPGRVGGVMMKACMWAAALAEGGGV